MKPLIPGNVVVVLKEGSDEARTIAREVSERLHGIGCEVFAPAGIRTDDPRVRSLRAGEKQSADLMVVVGGDGTILRAARDLGIAPILGVNAGGRGVLTELAPEDLDTGLKLLSKGQYVLERRMRLRARVRGKNLPSCLNEYYMMRIPHTATPSFHIALDDGCTLNQRMDGLIMATPTGSTGHSLSLGGPVVDMEERMMVLNPVGPVTRLPCLVMSPGRVRVSSNFPTSLIVDGQLEFRIPEETEIGIEMNGKDTVFCRLHKRVFRQLTNLGYG